MHTIPKQETYFQFQRSEMLPFVPASAKRVLDVGCGAGLFSRALKHKLGAEVWGVEPDPDAARQASTVLDRVLCSQFGPALDLGGGHV
jgi:ribosomal protein L11 methylase PrmA